MIDEADESLEWPLEGTEPGPELPLFQVRYDLRRNPRTGDVLKRLVLASGDWINVVARSADGRYVMVEQHRFGTGRVTIEPAGGMVDPGETAFAAARRELLEETGYGGGRWRYLGAVEPNPAVHDHYCHHWLADGVAPIQDPDPGAGEVIRVLLMTEAELRVAVADGRLRHVLALSALSRVLALFDRR